jgi:hypothetical protein
MIGPIPGRIKGPEKNPRLKRNYYRLDNYLNPNHQMYDFLPKR